MAAVIAFLLKTNYILTVFFPSQVEKNMLSAPYDLPYMPQLFILAKLW